MADQQESGPRRQPLSLDRIVAAALEAIDEQGIGVVSMRIVGARLGVRAMSLYRYVDSRETLFDAVVEKIVNELDDDPAVQAGPVDGWRPYLTSMAWGVRRYARGHPHAFPLVATRPTEAPWLNPPLRSLRWVEALLAALRADGLSADETLFAYRTFNSFLLGALLLETSAMVLADPQPGDGAFQAAPPADGTDPVDPADPVPAALTPTRSAAERVAVADADQPVDVVDPLGQVDPETYPMIHQLRDGLAGDYYEQEFDSGLEGSLNRIATKISGRR